MMLESNLEKMFRVVVKIRQVTTAEIPASSKLV